MKITYHHRTLGDGAEGVHIAQIIRALRAGGHEVDVVALVGEPPADGARRPASPRGAWISKVRRLVPRAAFELAEVGYGVVSSARLLKRMRASGASFLYERYGLANLAGSIATAALGVPFLLEVNSPLAIERQSYDEGGLAFPKTLARLERRVFAAADRCIVVSTPLARHLESVGIERRRIVVMPNGADPDRFDPASSGAAIRERHGLEGKLVVGFVGVVRRWHGLELLARAFAASAPPEAVLLVVGDGPACEELLAEARTLGIADRIRITGRVAHDEIAEHVAAMDVAVSPRATFYASPMKIAEYMAGGRAVVAPRMPNIEDMVEDGRTGLLFEPESAESLAAALGRLLSDGELRGRLAMAARLEVERRLNWAENARKIVRLAEQVSLEKARQLLRLPPPKERRAEAA